MAVRQRANHLIGPATRGIAFGGALIAAVALSSPLAAQTSTPRPAIENPSVTVDLSVLDELGPSSVAPKDRVRPSMPASKPSIRRSPRPPFLSTPPATRRDERETRIDEPPAKQAARKTARKKPMPSGSARKSAQISAKSSLPARTPDPLKATPAPKKIDRVMTAAAPKAPVKQALAKTTTAKPPEPDTGRAESKAPNAAPKSAAKEKVAAVEAAKSSNVKKAAMPAPRKSAAVEAPKKTARRVSSAAVAKTPAPVKTAAVTPDRAEAKPMSPLSTVPLAFAIGQATLNPQARKLVEAVASRLNSDGRLRLQLRAYAGGFSKSAKEARRLSLYRALAVRTHLIKTGVKSTRIRVRALGNKFDKGPPDRVDLVVSSR